MSFYYPNIVLQNKKQNNNKWEQGCGFLWHKMIDIVKIVKVLGVSFYPPVANTTN